MDKEKEKEKVETEIKRPTLYYVNRILYLILKIIKG